MEIRVGNFIIRSDALCIWIDEEYKSSGKSGAMLSKKVAGYSGCFSELNESFVRYKSRDNDATKAKEMLKQFADREKELLEMAKVLGGEIDKKLKKHRKLIEQEDRRIEASIKRRIKENE